MEKRRGEETPFFLTVLRERSWPHFPFFKIGDDPFYLLGTHISKAGLRLCLLILLGALQHGSHELLRGILISLRDLFAEHAVEKEERLFKVCCGLL